MSGRIYLRLLIYFNHMSDRIGKRYFCRHCGNVVEFIKDGGSPIVCCGEEMQILKEGMDGEE